MNNKLFGNIEKKTGVKMEDVFKLSNSLKHANFKDEETIRKVIKQVSSLAKKPVSKEKEDKIIHAILNNKVPKDISEITKMTGKK
ncbi:stage VI sporulation protein F [Aquibacillus halophilus]|uniref:Stage VI sporulation protein F n=1 Tax=Aquibacillus halophilus TaxID=930132 RepID=A0A6A8DCK7_9BACI|nr:stage VI sporulation protein F [Aquibacillus halophilus]MRH43425.1 stage VI sporulation protein F [Aquibacillus halophilus]